MGLVPFTSRLFLEIVKKIERVRCRIFYGAQCASEEPIPSAGPGFLPKCRSPQFRLPDEWAAHHCYQPLVGKASTLGLRDEAIELVSG